MIFDQIGDGGFALGARYPHQPQPAGGIAVEIGRHPAVGQMGIRHDDLTGQPQILLTDDGCRSLLRRFGRKAMTVGLGAADTDKDAAWPRLPGIVDNPRNLTVKSGASAGTVHKLFETHS